MGGFDVCGVYQDKLLGVLPRENGLYDTMVEVLLPAISLICSK